MWQTPAELHAALNDLPSILFILSLVFDLLGGVTKRESLKVAGFWTLVAGAVGAIAAVLSGLAAEESIEHGGSVHLLMERHETLAITVTIVFVGLAVWRIWRGGQLGPKERPTYLMIATVGALVVFWTAHLGGSMVYRYGAGIPTRAMEGALAERAAGHHHESDEAHGHQGGSTSPAGGIADSSQGAADHAHPSNTEPHAHD